MSQSEETRVQAVARLGAAVAARTGIKIMPAVEAKLLRIFGAMPANLLLAWVAELECLPHDHPEWASVIENLTVHESFFFRDRPQLDVLREHVLPGLIAEAAETGKRLRLWSAGCAAGEEAYTLAILLLETMRDLGWASGTPETGIRPMPPWQVSVLGTDISRPVLELARQGIYHGGELSPLRSLPLGTERWFETVHDEHGGGELRRVRDHLKPFVSFQPFNLVQPAPPLTGVQLVVCRNVFIYFSPEAQSVAQATFASALEPGGVLVMGRTDTMELPDRFQPSWHQDTVIYRRLQRSG